MRRGEQTKNIIDETRAAMLEKGFTEDMLKDPELYYKIKKSLMDSGNMLDVEFSGTLAEADQQITRIHETQRELLLM